MIDVAKAIQALDSNSQFVVTGSPSNEAEYKENVKFVSGADENGSAIFKDTQDFTWEQVSAKQSELQAEYDAEDWKRNRQAEYPSHEDCIHALLDGGDTLSDLQAKRQAVKDKYPKG
tara:strand:- start:182 stop:532 length:351 start_codon:yes stop_codon:yes gene_type:complete